MSWFRNLARPGRLRGDQLSGRDPIMDCPGGYAEYRGDVADAVHRLGWQILDSENLLEKWVLRV